MIVFITSLRHPLNNNSYERVLALAGRTLKSVCNQSSADFRVLIVCNEVPALAFSHPQIQFVRVSFPPPSGLASSRLAVEEVRRDKGSKYLVGLIHARRLKASHVMFFDADDFVSSRVAGFVRQHAGHNGWFMNAGYVYNARRNAFMILDEGFQTRCGTCYIVNTSLFAVPLDFPADASQECILSQFGRTLIHELLGSHRYLQDYLFKVGTPLEPLPFKGVIYHAEHGENWTRSFGFTKGLCRVALTDELRTEFNLWHGENDVTQASPAAVEIEPLQERRITE